MVAKKGHRLLRRLRRLRRLRHHLLHRAAVVLTVKSLTKKVFAQTVNARTVLIR
jgi:hypothetical protein